MSITDVSPFETESVSAELLEFRGRIREFAEEVVRPRALVNDQAPAEDFDWELVRAGHDLGLFRLVVPKEFGGLGYGVMGVAIMMEELAAVDAATALLFGSTMLGQVPVLLSNDPQLQSRFLPMFAGDEPVLACNAITEDVAGCDLLIPEYAGCAREVMTARRDGDHYVLNGRKRFINNAKVSTFGSVYATIEGVDPADGLTAFMVSFDSDGVQRGPVADKMGYRACLGSELLFHDVRVPAENVVGGEGAGVIINVAQMNMARATVAALSTGIARGAFELARNWCGERIQGGVPLYKHQFSARKLAEMASKVEASRLLYLDAAEVADNEIPVPAYKPAVAKLFADRIAIEVATEAMSLMGARGYIREFGMEKLVRESFGARIYEGTPEVLALAITESLYADDDDDF
ncbi:acyl-CoA dehydrogenase [Nocardia cyriacigeorgica]|uniref:Acyl-CoA dehydrogenase n=1 Tax=Nocardia cyriacigeorgica TaxID=135487 RepID=A0A5R8PCE1_9NOCA|nr:acyl-CoA dehydrogenase family protein [Nocardia cyriacigeorgica]TLG08783.1 acyl-CoA dehydrogenase [Nocardia cyriacigeorgica]